MRCFVVKQLYLDPSLCKLVYENTMHFNARNEHCHVSMVNGFRYALGASISEEMKYKIAQNACFWAITNTNNATIHQSGQGIGFG